MLGKVAAGERDTPRILEYDIDERSARFHELLEEWRESALGSLGWDENENASSIDPFVKDFPSAPCRAGTWFGLLEDVIAVRLGEKPKSGLSEDLALDELDALCSTELFPGSAVILGELRDGARTPAEGCDRFDHLAAARKIQAAAPRPARPRSVLCSLVHQGRAARS